MMEVVYAIRLTLAARTCIDEQHSYLKMWMGKEAADTWRQDILRVIGTLATLPKRCAIAKEDALFPEAIVRQLLYRRGRSPAAFRVLFTNPSGTEARCFSRGEEVPPCPSEGKILSFILKVSCCIKPLIRV